MAETAKLLLPSLGDVDSAEVVQVLVQAGENLAEGQVVALVESEKATLEVPAPAAGTVLSVQIALGDQIKEGDCLLEYSASTASQSAQQPAPQPAPQAAQQPASQAAQQSAPQAAQQSASQAAQQPAQQPARPGTAVYAGPAVRRLARQLGVDLRQVTGTGIKSRIQAEDLHQWVRDRLAGATGSALPKTPFPDLSKHGPTQRVPLGRISQVAARRLHASWVNIPHVTQHDLAVADALEALRKELKPEAKRREVSLTPLPFLLRACAEALVDFPLLRSALEPGGEALIRRDSYHIGLAVDTPDGLLVPVLRDVRTKDIWQLAEECGTLAAKARQGGLTPDDMSGGVFTISSLGGIGGTAFTPIINPPEVAVLGVSKMQTRLVRDAEGDFADELLLPLSLSYDHRVINGAEAARFTGHLAGILGEPRRLL